MYIPFNDHILYNKNTIYIYNKYSIIQQPTQMHVNQNNHGFPEFLLLHRSLSIKKEWTQVIQ